MYITRVCTIAACVSTVLVNQAGSVKTAAAQSGDRRVIEVVVKRYEFIPPSIEVMQGERVRLVVKSGDGLHGFGIKQFDISKEVPRGETVNIDFTPATAGEFPILCTEYCGEGHEQMKGVLVVKAREASQP